MKLQTKFQQFDINQGEIYEVNKYKGLSLIKKLQNEPGVYAFLPDYSTVLYIGSTRNVRKRILFYFSEHISRESLFFYSWRVKYPNLKFCVFYSNNHKELEEFLIHKYKPRFNSTLKKKALTAFSLIKELTDGEEKGAVRTSPTSSIEFYPAYPKDDGVDYAWLRKRVKKVADRKDKSSEKKIRQLAEL